MVMLSQSSHRTGRLGRFATLLALACLCLSSGAQAWWNKDWAFRKQITIDGTAKGANVSGAVDNFPVLIRLHDGVLNFADANPDGSDLRFVADDDKTPLKYQVEKFDNVFNLGFVWVQVPHIASDKPTTIYLYYGNNKATAGGDSVYDADQVLTYHFGERGAPAADSSNAKNTAGNSFSVDESGLIGNSAKFDGTTVLPIPASPSLAMAPGASLTWSAWVKLTAADPNAIIYARRDSVGSFIVGAASGSPYVGIGDGAAAPTLTVPGAPPADNNRHPLPVVSPPQLTTLYVDGTQRSVLPRGIPAISGPASVGGDGGVGQPVQQGFHGEVDELEIAKTARSAGFVQLLASNEGASDKLVQLGADEQQSSFSTGYVGIILGSVTLDGWVVIGILIVMMIISWGIMATKGRQVGRAAKANRAFLDAFEELNGDFVLLHTATKTPESSPHKIDSDDLELMQDAPLMHMFHSGIDELQKRVGGAHRRNPSAVLSEQSIEAIRATLNAKLLRETQTLNKRMVLLTIAISGGPFIGLLGTVVGVMITFAAVAAAGDVNVNAIAPGIAAALAATVAGLFVAIPALFGYNYLISRVKECSTEMHVFIEAFVTRMAESYDEPAELEKLAD